MKKKNLVLFLFLFFVFFILESCTSHSAEKKSPLKTTILGTWVSPQNGVVIRFGKKIYQIQGIWTDTRIVSQGYYAFKKNGQFIVFISHVEHKTENYPFRFLSSKQILIDNILFNKQLIIFKKN